MQTAVRAQESKLAPALVYISGSCVFKSAYIVAPETKTGTRKGKAAADGLCLDGYDAEQSPPQCTGNFWPPTVAERAKRTASPSPLSLTSSSNTALLYKYV